MEPEDGIISICVLRGVAANFLKFYVTLLPFAKTYIIGG